MVEIKNAAVIVLLRKNGSTYSVLIGKRVSTVAFMPSKYVFPGGAWEKLDNAVPVAKAMNEQQRHLLTLETEFSDSSFLGITAIRELWEETGLRLSCKGQFGTFPESWKEFFFKGQGPNLKNLHFFFRAITPPGRVRRFDARFFFCNAEYIENDLDNFSEASGELNSLQWVDISQTKYFELPKITKIVIEHLVGLISADFIYDYIPFYSGGPDGLNKKKLWL